MPRYIALELQGIAGAQPDARCVTMVHGKRAQARIIVAAGLETLAVQAFALATDIVLALCAGRPIALRARLVALKRTAQQFHPDRCKRPLRPASPARRARPQTAPAGASPFPTAQAQYPAAIADHAS